MPLTFIFFRGIKTTNQLIYSHGIAHKTNPDARFLYSNYWRITIVTINLCFPQTYAGPGQRRSGKRRRKLFFFAAMEVARWTGGTKGL